MSEDGKQSRTLPISDLDFSLMTTDNLWGKHDVPDSFKQKLKKYYKTVTTDKDGKVTEEIETDSLWDLLGFYTRDMRLANLSVMHGEVEYCRFHLDLANDLLQSNFVRPFLITLSRVATVLEISQSKGGFLRKQMNTFTEQKMSGEMEPPKKSLFGGSGKRKEGY